MPPTAERNLQCYTLQVGCALAGRHCSLPLAFVRLFQRQDEVRSACHHSHDGVAYATQHDPNTRQKTRPIYSGDGRNGRAERGKRRVPSQHTARSARA